MFDGKSSGVYLRVFGRTLIVGCLAVVCASCGSTPARKPTMPVEGKVFHKNEKTPAVGALVVFRPLAETKPEDWPDGYPRGKVDADGTFKLTSYVDNDGAPAGEYAVLIQWPRKTQAADEDPEEAESQDRLGGAFNNEKAPRWRKQVKAGGSDPKEFVFVIP